MFLFRKETSQSSGWPFSFKMLVTLVGAMCLGVAFLVITPIHAAPSPQAKQPTAGKISGGGCTGGDLRPCIRAKNGQIVSEVFVTKSRSQPAEVPFCPTSVTIKLFGNGLITSSLVGSGCGHFSGPTTAIQPKVAFSAQVVACFSDNPGDCGAVPSPELTVS